MGCLPVPCRAALRYEFEIRLDLLWELAARAVDRWLQERGWPDSVRECQDCVGAGREHGCWCLAMGTNGPTPPPWTLGWRLLHGLLFIHTSPFWTDAQHGLDRT